MKREILRYIYSWPRLGAGYLNVTGIHTYTPSSATYIATVNESWNGREGG